MKTYLLLLLLLLLGLVACTPDAAPTPTPPDNDDGDRPRTEEAMTTAIPTKIAPTAVPQPTLAAPNLPTAADFPTLPDVPGNPLALVDQVGGAAMAVALAGDSAFMGEGLRLTAVSLTDPANPIVVGRSVPLGGVVRQVELYRDAAYVVAEPGWIDVLDVGKPAQIRRIAQLPLAGEVQSIAIADNFLFVTAITGKNETALTAWDISGIATAVPTASLMLPTSLPNRLTSTGELLLVSQTERIDIFDITKPGQPIAVGEISGFEGFAFNPVLPLADGRLLYANEFFHQFAIADPAAIRVTSAPIGNFMTGDDGPRRGGFLTMQGETAVLIDTGYFYAPVGPSQLWTIDVSAAEPVPQPITELPFTAHDVVFQGTLAVVAHEHGLSLIELADVAAPVVLGGLEWGTPVSLSGQTVGFATGSTVPSDVFTFDLADSDTRQTFLALQTPNRGSAVLGDKQFIIAPGVGLVQLDVHNPVAPQGTAIVNPQINALRLNDTWLYGTGSGLQTFALDETGTLQSVTACDDCYDGGIHKIVSLGPDTLHLLGQNGIYLVAGADPTELAPLGVMPSDFPLIDGVVVEMENAAYYLGTTCHFEQTDCAGSTLWTLHTIRPSEPEIKNALTVPGNARKLFLFNEMLWILTTGGRLFPYDLTDPLAPQPSGQAVQLPLATTLVQTAVVGETLYVFHPETGILAYRQR